MRFLGVFWTKNRAFLGSNFDHFMRCWKFFRSKVRIWTISHKKKLHVPDLNEGEKDIELERESR